MIVWLICIECARFSYTDSKMVNAFWGRRCNLIVVLVPTVCALSGLRGWEPQWALLPIKIVSSELPVPSHLEEKKTHLGRGETPAFYGRLYVDLIFFCPL